MAKIGRPPPDWFERLVKLELEDDEYLTHREIAEKLGLDQNNVRMTLMRYEAESETELENNRAVKRFRVKSLRSMAKKALAGYGSS